MADAAAVNAVDDYASGLKATLESTPDLKRKGQRWLRVLKARPSKLRTLRLGLMEARCRAELIARGYGEDGKIDWSKIDWKAIISIVLQVLAVILPLLML